MPAPTDGCDAILIQNVVNENLSDNVRNEILSNVTKSVWERLSSEAGGAVSYLGISLGGSYEEFKQNFRTESSNYNSLYTRGQTVSIMRRYLKDEQINKWAECKEDSFKSREDGGFACWTVTESDRYVTVVFRWKEPRNVTTERVETQISGGELAQENVSEQDRLPANKVFAADEKFAEGEVRRTFVRKPDSEFILNVTVYGSDSEGTRSFDDGISLVKQDDPALKPVVKEEPKRVRNTFQSPELSVNNSYPGETFIAIPWPQITNLKNRAVKAIWYYPVRGGANLLPNGRFQPIVPPGSSDPVLAVVSTSIISVTVIVLAEVEYDL